MYNFNGQQPPFNNFYQPNYPIPPMMPLPTNLKEYKESLKILRKTKRFLSEYEKEVKGGEKKEEKKKSNFNRWEVYLLLCFSSPFIVMIYGGLLLFTLNKFASAVGSLPH